MTPPTTSRRIRVGIATLALSAAGLFGIVQHEGYQEVAKPPVPGDVPTIGFGSTGPDIKNGDRTDPVKSLGRAVRDVQRFEGAIKECVHVPLSQAEYDAYVSLAYNIGPRAFCGSTLVKKLNASDYDGACAQILAWDKFKGRSLPGLTKRRQEEYRKCMGE